MDTSDNMSQLEILNSNNAIKIFQTITSTPDCEEKFTETQKFIEDNFEKVLTDSHNDLTTLSIKLLCQLLSSDKLNISSEIPVWQAIEMWVNAEKSIRLEKHLPLLTFQCLRFGRLQRDFIEKSIFKGDLFSSLSAKKQSKLTSLIKDVLSGKFTSNEIGKETTDGQPYLSSVVHFRPRISKELLVCLNYNSSHNRSEVDYFDTEQNVWKQSPSFKLPSRAESFNVQTVDGGKQIYLFGGHIGFLEYTTVNDTWKIDLDSSSSPKWTKKCPMLNARYDFANVFLDGAIYALGGQKDECKNTLVDCEKYDVIKNVWSAIAPLNYPRSKARAAVFKSKIYIAGGLSDGFEPTATVEVYEPKTNRWKPVTSMSTPRVSFAMVLFANRLWVIGGCAQNLMVSSCESYDPETDTWQEEASLNQKIRNHKGVIFNGEMHVVGGNVGYPKTAYTERYVPASKRWFKDTPLVQVGICTGHQLVLVPIIYKEFFTTESLETNVEENVAVKKVVKNSVNQFTNNLFIWSFLIASLGFFIYFMLNSNKPWLSNSTLLASGLFILIFFLIFIIYFGSSSIGNLFQFCLTFCQQLVTSLKQLLSGWPFRKKISIKPYYCGKYEIDHFHCISLAYYNFKQFNKNLFEWHPNRYNLSQDDIALTKEYIVESLKSNKKAVAEFEQTLKRAKFTVAKLPVGMKTEADTALFIRRELRQFKCNDKVCLLIYVSSHGTDEAFYCEDGLFSIDRLIDQVEMCRNLNFSPKVLILDTCREAEDGGLHLLRSEHPTPPSPKGEMLLKPTQRYPGGPKSFNFLVVYACLKSYFSYSENGGLLTKKLTEVIKEHCSANSSSPQFILKSLLDIAMDRLSKETIYIERKDENEDNEEIVDKDENENVKKYDKVCKVGLTLQGLDRNVMLNHLKAKNEKSKKYDEVYQVGLTRSTLPKDIELNQLDDLNEENEKEETINKEDNEENEPYNEEIEGYTFERFFGLNYAK